MCQGSLYKISIFRPQWQPCLSFRGDFPLTSVIIYIFWLFSHDALRRSMELIHRTSWVLGCEGPDQRPRTGKVAGPTTTPLWCCSCLSLVRISQGKQGGAEWKEQGEHIWGCCPVPLRAHYRLPQSQLILALPWHPRTSPGGVQALDTALPATPRPLPSFFCSRLPTH